MKIRMWDKIKQDWKVVEISPTFDFFKNNKYNKEKNQIKGDLKHATTRHR